jgi:hypothetical protein
MCLYYPHNFTCCPLKIFGAKEGEEKYLHCVPCQKAIGEKKKCTKTKNRIIRNTIILIEDQKCYSCRKEWASDQNAAIALRAMSYNDVFAGKGFDLDAVEAKAKEKENDRREEAALALLELRYDGGERGFRQDEEDQPEQGPPIFHVDEKIYRVRRIEDSRLFYGKLQYKALLIGYPPDRKYYSVGSFEGCEELMDEFHANYPERPKAENEKRRIESRKSFRNGVIPPLPWF